MLLSFFVLYPGEGKGKRLKIPAVSAGGKTGGRIAAVCRLFRLLSLSLIPLGVFFCFLFEFPVPSAAAVNSPAGGGVWRQKERRRRRGGGVGGGGRRSHFLFLRLFPPGGGEERRRPLLLMFCRRVISRSTSCIFSRCRRGRDRSARFSVRSGQRVSAGPFCRHRRTILRCRGGIPRFRDVPD